MKLNKKPQRFDKKNAFGKWQKKTYQTKTETASRLRAQGTIFHAISHKSVQTPRNSLNTRQTASHCTHWIWNSSCIQLHMHNLSSHFTVNAHFCNGIFSSFRRAATSAFYPSLRFRSFLLSHCHACFHLSMYVIIVSFVKRAFFSHFTFAIGKKPRRSAVINMRETSDEHMNYNCIVSSGVVFFFRAHCHHWMLCLQSHGDHNANYDHITIINIHIYLFPVCT